MGFAAARSFWLTSILRVAGRSARRGRALSCHPMNSMRISARLSWRRSPPGGTRIRIGSPAASGASRDTSFSTRSVQWIRSPWSDGSGACHRQHWQERWPCCKRCSRRERANRRVHPSGRFARGPVAVAVSGPAPQPAGDAPRAPTRATVATPRRQPARHLRQRRNSRRARPMRERDRVEERVAFLEVPNPAPVTGASRHPV